MRKVSHSKFVVFMTSMSLIVAAALTFAFAQRGAAQEQEQQRPLRPIQRPIVTNAVQEKQAVQIRELEANVAALNNQINEMKQAIDELKACCEKQQASKADVDKQIFETKLRLTTLEKDYKGHTHQNLKLGVSGNNVIVLDPNKVEKLKFPLSGPVQH
jgi:TolA-binding protein